ncbi:MAG TPA: hypothetical protein VJM34_05940 [Novosphingobium sp.]|nr:hypothetical protein [Novosphingobium sp.]
MRRRALVLCSDAARHPFRQSLPLHVTGLLEPDEPEKMRGWKVISRRDWREFLTAYCATFAAVTVFIT